MHALASECGLSHEDLRDYAAQVTNGRCDSTSDLSEVEAQEIISHLQKVAPGRGKAVKEVARRTIQYHRQKTGVESLPTSTHTSFMWRLARERGISQDGLAAMCKRMLGHEKPLSTKETSKIIEALKAMNKRDADKQQIVSDMEILKMATRKISFYEANDLFQRGYLIVVEETTGEGAPLRSVVRCFGSHLGDYKTTEWRKRSETKAVFYVADSMTEALEFVHTEQLKEQEVAA